MKIFVVYVGNFPHPTSLLNIPSLKVEDKFWQRPKKHFLSDSDQSASHSCWQIIPQSLGKFHAHSNNLSQQCVICWPEVRSVLKENPKLIRKWKGFWNWSLGMRGIWGMKMESASSAAWVLVLTPPRHQSVATSHSKIYNQSLDADINFALFAHFHPLQL